MKPDNEEIILTQIGVLKDELIKIGNNKGFLHHETIKASQKLDEIIIKYQKLKYLG